MSSDDIPQNNTKQELSRVSSTDSESSRSTRERSANNSATNVNETNNTSARPTLHHSSRSTSTSNISFAANTNINQSKFKHHPSRLKSHNRSLSHNKLNNKLSTSSSTTGTLRPNLNRSKSTDGLIKGARHNSVLKRNGRSFTKITGLQPLTKTMSNQSLKSNKSTTSLKASGSSASVGLKTSSKKGKAILSLNDDDADFEDLDEPVEQAPIPERFDSQETISSTHSNSAQNIPSLYEQINRIVPDPTPLEENKKLEVLEENTTKEDPSINKPDLVPNDKSFNEDFSNNLYGGSLLLSQSTGLIKKIDARLPEVYGNDDLKYSESTSGISFKANPMENHQNIAQPVTTNKNVVQNNSYQPNQTIFNNLQRTNNQYMQNRKQPDRPSTKAASTLNNGANNFSDFLKSNDSSADLNSSSHNLETRTQQRLWLQRESSLMDVTNLDSNRMSNFSNLSLNNLMFAHNYNQSQIDMREMNGSTPNQHLPSSLGQSTPGVPDNYHSSNMTGLLTMVQSTHNSIQSRTEYERLNREYLNVRRHLNPVGESLNRVDQYLHKDEIKIVKHKKSETNENVNSFKEYSSSYMKKEGEISSTINRLWQDAIVSTSSQNPRAMQQAHQGQRAFHRPTNPRIASFGQQQYPQYNNGLTDPKAMKLANPNE